MAILMTPSLAKGVLYNSENKYDGHTLRKHVNISNKDLYLRSEHDSVSGKFHTFTAFLDIHQCCNILSELVNQLKEKGEFFQYFHSQPEGTEFSQHRSQLVTSYKVRISQGRLETRYFTLVAAKRSSIAPLGLHVITFFPAFPVLPMSNKDREAARKDKNSFYI